MLVVYYLNVIILQLFHSTQPFLGNYFIITMETKCLEYRCDVINLLATVSA